MTVEFQRIGGFHELRGGGSLSDEAQAELLGVDLSKFRELRGSMQRLVSAGVDQLLGTDTVRARLGELPRDFTFACVGDSQTAGHQSWAEMLGGALAAIRPDVHLLNLAKSGDTSMDLVRRLSIALGVARPSLFIVFIGANDACRTLPFPGEMFLSDDQTRSNLQRLADITGAHGGRVAWVTPAPLLDDVVASFPVFKEMGIRYFSAEVDKKAQIVRDRPEPVVDLWKTFDADRLPELLAIDGVHLAPDGHVEVARRVILEALG
jgi:lysophospholipase L1-like esterase